MEVLKISTTTTSKLTETPISKANNMTYDYILYVKCRGNLRVNSIYRYVDVIAVMYTILHRSYGRRCRARREKQILELVVKAVCVNTTSDLSARPVISAADVVWQASSAGSSIYCIVPSAHRHTVVLNTARDLLDTNQTHQRVVLHNVTQVLTCCCPVKIIASIPDELIAWTAMQALPENFTTRCFYVRTDAICSYHGRQSLLLTYKLKN